MYHEKKFPYKLRDLNISFIICLFSLKYLPVFGLLKIMKLWSLHKNRIIECGLYLDLNKKVLVFCISLYLRTKISQTYSALWFLCVIFPNDIFADVLIKYYLAISKPIL